MSIQYINEDKTETRGADREWMILRRLVRERANGICERCHVAPISDTHHLTYARKGHERLEDLMGLCRPCHKFVSAIIDVDPMPPWAPAFGPVLRQYGLLTSPEPYPDFNLSGLVEQAIKDLPNSEGANYLEMRNIPLDVAMKLNVGYVAGRDWPVNKKDINPAGYIVFPETNIKGELISLLGRAIEENGQLIGPKKWDRLGKGRGYFNCTALNRKSTVIISNNPFETLAFISQGAKNAMAIDGASDFRWTWAIDALRLFFTFDLNASGEYWSKMGGMAHVLCKEARFGVAKPHYEDFGAAMMARDTNFIQKAINLMEKKDA